ncbi:circadian clock-controlled protein daywake-like [Rhynchophorus ferrugineus]|uniref:circadian clock-controlled protein daywake-like n=1 Tax=Rhynchophorus ferrugineus TaxID=354439 RepID=UPI003FCC3A9E
MLKQLFGAFLVVFAWDAVYSKGIPSFIHLCKRRGGNLDQCVLDNAGVIQPRLKKGVPELFIPPMDPLVIPEATLDSGDRFKATFKNIQLFHADDFKLEQFKIDLDKGRVNILIFFPRLRIKSDYSVNGRLLILQLNGHGPADGNYTNIRTTLELKGTTFTKNNKEYMKWEKETIDIKIEKMQLQFDRIFGDNEELNQQTNRVINENIDGIVGELQPVIEGVVADFVFGILNRIFSKYSVNELFVD